MDIGEKIKNLRTILGLTQEELADRAELTKGFISQLERGLTSPSISSLEDVLEALGTNISDFFKEEKEERFVFKKIDAFETIFENGNSKLEWIVPNAQKNDMEPIILKLEPGAKSKQIEPHQGEEFGYVLSGRIYLVREGYKKGAVIRRGDTFYIRGDVAHYLENRSKQSAEVLWISTPPEF